MKDVRVRLYGRATAIVTFTATIAWRYGSERGMRSEVAGPAREGLNQ